MNVIKIDKVAAMRERERERSVLSLKMQTCKVSLKGYYCYRHCYRSLDLSQEHGKRGSALPRMDGERAGSVNGSIIREKSGDVYLNEDNEGEGRIDETKIILSLSFSSLQLSQRSTSPLLFLLYFGDESVAFLSPLDRI